MHAAVHVYAEKSCRAHIGLGQAFWCCHVHVEYYQPLAASMFIRVEQPQAGSQESWLSPMCAERAALQAGQDRQQLIISGLLFTCGKQAASC